VKSTLASVRRREVMGEIQASAWEQTNARQKLSSKDYDLRGGGNGFTGLVEVATILIKLGIAVQPDIR